MGRFISRDTWKGNSRRPISYNRWAYANSSPLVYLDPSGHTPIYNGYNEGWSAMALFPGLIWEIRGEEIVYDFATLERASFNYYGRGKGNGQASGFCFDIVSLSTSVYVSGMSGFDAKGIQQYSGDSVSFFLSGNLPKPFYIAGIGAGIGVSSSTAWPGNWIPNWDVTSTSITTSAWLGDTLDHVPAAVGGYHSFYTITSDVKKYRNTDDMLKDIYAGDNSPVGFAFVFALRGVILSLSDLTNNPNIGLTTIENQNEAEMGPVHSTDANLNANNGSLWDPANVSSDIIPTSVYQYPGWSEHEYEEDIYWP